MRIGVDLDDTICSTRELVQKTVKQYAKKHDMDSFLIMSDEELHYHFFQECLESIFARVSLKKRCIKEA